MTTAMPQEITTIDPLARQYADAQLALDALTNELKVEIDAAVRRRWPDLKRATARTAERYEALFAAVSEAQAAFDKPKTRILHGVRVGFRKQKGSIVVLNEENTCALIRKVLPDQEQVLIATSDRVVMAALEPFDNDMLRKIGCKRVPGKDEAVAKLADTEIDKVVAALMKGAIEKAESEA